MSPKLFVISLLILALSMIVVPWLRGKKSQTRLPPDDALDRRVTQYRNSDGRPDPALNDLDDVAAEISDASVDAPGDGAD